MSRTLRAGRGRMVACLKTHATHATVADQLRHLARRVERLRPSWRDPSLFLAARSALVYEVRMLAVPRSPTAIHHEQADPLADQRLGRAHALLRAREGEIAQLRRLLATTRPRPRRRQLDDARQLALGLGR